MYFKHFTWNILFNHYFFNFFGMWQYQVELLFKTPFKIKSRIGWKYFAKSTVKFQINLLYVCQSDLYSFVEHTIPANFENMPIGCPQFPNTMY